MIFIHEKLRYNFFVMIFACVGFVITEIVLMMFWVMVLIPAGNVDGVSKLFGWETVIPVAFTIFWAYLAGALLRGLEKHSHGLDLHAMDAAEIDIEIALLEKEKRMRDNENVNRKDLK